MSNIRHTTANRVAIIVPFQEPITYYARSETDFVISDDFTAYSVDRARRKKVQKQDWPGVGVLLNQAELVWQIVKTYIAVEPHTDDFLVDGTGQGWTVLKATEQFNGQVYNLLCRKRV